jgi:quercetin dioxygenase-like cupin family protein
MAHAGLAFGIAALATSTVGTADLPMRVPIANLPVTPAKTVSRVETTEVDFAPGQKMPEHKHTVPVVCFVAKGSFAVSIGDAPERIVPTGQVTLEPAEAIVHYFRNVSATEPAELLCASLAGDQDKVLNVMLAPPGG